MYTAIGRGRDLAVGFLPWLAGRYEDDFVKIESAGNLARRDQVTMVDRVEGAAHHAQAVPLVRVGRRESDESRRPRWSAH